MAHILLRMVLRMVNAILDFMFDFAILSEVIVSILPFMSIPAYFFAVCFLLIDKTDEYQLLFFILQIRGFQFVSDGLINVSWISWHGRSNMGKNGRQRVFESWGMWMNPTCLPYVCQMSVNIYIYIYTVLYNIQYSTYIYIYIHIMYMFLLYLSIRHSMALYGHDRVRSTHQTMRRRAYVFPQNCADGGPGEGDIYPL